MKNSNDKDKITKSVLNVLLHYVGISWIIETSQQLKYDTDKNNPDCMIDGPWNNTYIFTK